MKILLILLSLMLINCGHWIFKVEDCSFTEYEWNLNQIQTRSDSIRLLNLYRMKTSETGSSECFHTMIDLRDWICFLENDQDCRYRWRGY